MSIVVSVILTVLKILGIILLGILAILLLVLLVLLFVPVTYKGEVIYKEDLYGKVKVGWLFNLISLTLTYDEGELEQRIRVFKVLKDKSEEENEKEDEKGQAKHTPKKEPIPRPQKGLQQVAAPKEMPKEQKTPTIQLEKDTIEKSNEPVMEISTEGETEESIGSIKPVGEIKPIPPIEIKDVKAIKEIKEVKEIKGLKKKEGNKILKQLKYAYNHPDRRYAVKKLLVILKKLWKHFKPKRFSLNMDIGLEDPADTGKLIGAVHVLKPFLDRDSHILIRGDFNQNIINVDGKLKGSVYAYYLVYLAAVVYFDKRFRKYILDVIKYK